MRGKSILLIAIAALFLLRCAKDDGPANELPDDSKTGNLLATGDSAGDILGNENFSDLVIEIIYNPGFLPNPASMTNFVTFLEERTFKQDISLVYRELPSTGFSEINIQQAADFEDENRSLYNQGNTLAIYIFFSDTRAEGDDFDSGLVTLGAVYRNTSMIIYGETVQFLDAQSTQISKTDIETATLMHEFGHLFGLVNLGTPQVNTHDDPASPNHCVIDGCLMRSEIEFGSGLMGVMESRVGKGSIVPPLDSECILDLQGNGGQ